ncbi:hypothetical protein GXV23_005723, partial [Escherichia coli]|nr:hypothetical protein [Escherichia coli]EEQ2662674.1 hypothetical protein [Escherichia coli]EEQ2799518.1 hypothetical protein [Escherichia coli]EEQ3938366.1 hypothetical protein [Escherichia coli]EEQ4036638.1 hypothetical protein [Escherichia coli]
SLNDVAEIQQNGCISHAEREKDVRAFDLGKAVKIALRRREHAVNAVGLRKSLTVDDGNQQKSIVKLSD